MKKVLRFILISLVFIVGFAALIRLMENKMVFFPTKYPGGFWQPEQFGVTASDHYFQTSDGVRLHAWLCEQPDTQAILLIMHGNAGNLSHRVDWLRRLRDAVPADLFIFDYRGYGRSDGSPTEAGVYLDAQAAYAYVRDQLGRPAGQIFLHGRSLGGAIAVDLATQVPHAGLILESTFSSGQDMAKTMFGFIPVYLFTSIQFDAAAKIAECGTPKLFIHGRRDSIVPFSLGRKLYELAPEPKIFIELPNADHNDVYVAGGARYYQGVRRFVLDVVARRDGDDRPAAELE